MTTKVALPPAALPKSETKQVSAKREFEKIILEICRKFAESRAIAGEYIEALIKRSEENYSSRTFWHWAGTLSEAVTGVGTGAVAYKLGSKVPEAFQMGVKVGEVFKSGVGFRQYSQNMEQEKIQHANSQWSTFANGAQDAIRNLKAAQQRLQQMEDNINR
ncbi:MAG: hypothetical protein JSS10_07740 [Verrucomicrobia bacterium]|nr:hypothetical protein [Verrucomicrobiota bacterium]